MKFKEFLESVADNEIKEFGPDQYLFARELLTIEEQKVDDGEYKLEDENIPYYGIPFTDDYRAWRPLVVNLSKNQELDITRMMNIYDMIWTKFIERTTHGHS